MRLLSRLELFLCTVIAHHPLGLLNAETQQLEFTFQLDALIGEFTTPLPKPLDSLSLGQLGFLCS